MITAHAATSLMTPKYDAISRYARSFSTSDPEAGVRAVIGLAGELADHARGYLKARERRRADGLVRILDDPVGRIAALSLADQMMLAEDGVEVTRRPPLDLPEGCDLTHLLSPLRQMWAMFSRNAARRTPGLVKRRIVRLIRREIAALIIPAAPAQLHAHLEQRRRGGLTPDVHPVGGPATGRIEADDRMESLVKLVADPVVSHVSFALTDLIPDMGMLAFDRRAADMKDRLRVLYRAAIKHSSRGGGEGGGAKYLTIEVRKSSDMELVAEVFMRALGDDMFAHLAAGISLPAWHPGARAVLDGLLDWARGRVAGGGAPVGIRLVKDAAPDTRGADADFIRMLRLAMLPENTAAVRVEVATRNLFDIAHALLLAGEHGGTERPRIVLRDGMANHLALALRDAGCDIRLRVSAARCQDMRHAGADMLHHLDVMGAPDRFARDIRRLDTGSAAWAEHGGRFQAACIEADEEPTAAETRDRSTAEGRKKACPDNGRFQCEPTTDWSLAANRKWIAEVISAARDAEPVRVPLVIGGLEYLEGDAIIAGIDPSRPGRNTCLFTLADEHQVEAALGHAEKAALTWAATTSDTRRAMLFAAAGLMAESRGEAVAALVMDAGKTIEDADAEVSRAIDAANHCARAFDEIEALADIAPQPIGVVSVITSRFSPYAIPCESALAALMAGNAVILKPGGETALCAWTLCRQLWRAGIPREVLQFVPAPGNHIGSRLVTSLKGRAVLFSGTTETAAKFRKWRKTLRLHAATSARNTMLLTNSADPAPAVRDLARAAFANSGQDCLAVPIAIVEAGLYDSPAFRKLLLDAASSLPIGPGWDPASLVTPLQRAPSRDLERALTRLDPGEEWLVKPREISRSPCLWTPGIRMGVRPGSWFHLTDCPGPVLGVMRAESLDQAIDFQNHGNHDLAAGLHSLDKREIARWRDAVEAGTLFINRPPHGPQAALQPTGGWKRSVFGPRTMAGGPNQVFSLCDWEQMDMPRQPFSVSPDIQEALAYADRWLKNDLERQVVHAAARSYLYFQKHEFGPARESSRSALESVIFRYRPLPLGVLVRLGREIDPTTLCGVVLATMITGVPVEFSLHAPSSFADALGLPAVVETDEMLAARVSAGRAACDRMRAPNGASELLVDAAATAGIPLSQDAVLANGRLELLHYYREQSISQTLHRHGFLLTPSH